jgi:hypothetical protein
MAEKEVVAKSEAVTIKGEYWNQRPRIPFGSFLFQAPRTGQK